LKYKKIGLCKILKKFRDNVYQIELPEGIEISLIFNVPDLYQYQEGDEAKVNEEDEKPTTWRKQLSISKPEEVEEAMDKKITKTRYESYKQYLVKWKGKPQKKSKWIPKPDLKKLRGEKFLISNLNEDAQHSSNRG
jgi:hypothetical protein